MDQRARGDKDKEEKKDEDKEEEKEEEEEEKGEGKEGEEEEWKSKKKKKRKKKGKTSINFQSLCSQTLINTYGNKLACHLQALMALISVSFNHFYSLIHSTNIFEHLLHARHFAQLWDIWRKLHTQFLP